MHKQKQELKWIILPLPIFFAWGYSYSKEEVGYLEDYEIVPAIYFVDRTKPTLMITDGTVLLNNSSLNRLKDGCDL